MLKLTWPTQLNTSRYANSSTHPLHRHEQRGGTGSGDFRADSLRAVSWGS